MLVVQLQNASLRPLLWKTKNNLTMLSASILGSLFSIVILFQSTPM
ncbi:hypothetical protein L580_1926 [Serratia fonticola AU-P3(3)]|nr:hypothetical protein L580_1926 [Serratia fonticola AU-P3(3)]